jgi:hypothetical protein
MALRSGGAPYGVVDGVRVGMWEDGENVCYSQDCPTTWLALLSYKLSLVVQYSDQTNDFITNAVGPRHPEPSPFT